jgi:NifU-like protein involved in Fe-S cluster formation
VTKGSGSDANPNDGDRIFIEVELREGKVISIVPRVTGGCETSRIAVSGLVALTVRRTADEASEITVADLLEAIGPVDAVHERCVLTAIGALRSALIDAHVTALAEATVESRKLRPR